MSSGTQISLKKTWKTENSWIKMTGGVHRMWGTQNFILQLLLDWSCRFRDMAS